MESEHGSVEVLQTASKSSLHGVKSSLLDTKGADGDYLTSDEEFSEDMKQETLVERLNLLRLNNPYRDLDERRHTIRQKIKEKFKAAPKTVLDEAEENKPPIEKRLEDTDKVLADLLAFGTEIITNIKVANEKRELLRREFESTQRVDLEGDLSKESMEAMARYNDIVARWSELGELKEPMVMFEKLEEQKERIAELMRSKDNMIAQCQREIDRINERFEEDQIKQQTDVCALVERIDGQIELLKKAYKHHLDLLEDTIESERQTIALKEQQKWTQFYNTMQDNEQYKLDMAKQKKLFYTSEIQRITSQQEEITRATRIRLEKDAEMLEYELRSTKNQVLMNSEKLDYNYQVLQKRNEENVIINNQQKRRVAKLNEALSDIKKRINSTQINAEHSIAKLTGDIQKLHDSITDLEKKSESFRLSNRKKFFSVWDINFQEVKTLIEKVFDIDRILHEQQLGVVWQRPDVDLEEFEMVRREKALFEDAQSFESVSSSGSRESLKMKNANRKSASLSLSKPGKDFRKRQTLELLQKAEEERKRQEQRIEIRLLRNILRKVADRGGFLVEDRLLEFLEPYTEEQKTLVRIDNIFAALRITDMQAVNRLVEYFKPYAWCPNCMKGIPREQLKKLYRPCQLPHLGRINADDDDYDDDDLSLTDKTQSIECAAEESSSMNKASSLTKVTGTQSGNETATVSACDNHFLIVESAMVLTALNEFTNQQTKSFEEESKRRQTLRASTAIVDSGSGKTKPAIVSIDIDNEIIYEYWRKFLNYMPKEKQKLWHSLEHGLQHYLEVLKQREQLDKDCAFLRRQNAELKHLLQKFQV